MKTRDNLTNFLIRNFHSPSLWITVEQRDGTERSGVRKCKQHKKKPQNKVTLEPHQQMPASTWEINIFYLFIYSQLPLNSWCWFNVGWSFDASARFKWKSFVTFNIVTCVRWWRILKLSLTLITCRPGLVERWTRYDMKLAVKYDHLVRVYTCFKNLNISKHANKSSSSRHILKCTSTLGTVYDWLYVRPSIKSSEINPRRLIGIRQWIFVYVWTLFSLIWIDTLNYLWCLIVCNSDAWLIIWLSVNRSKFDETILSGRCLDFLFYCCCCCCLWP